MSSGDDNPYKELLASGARWLRADLHLHTQADRQFRGVPEGTSFEKAWVDRLEEEEIHLGVITNHNKFQLHEYKSLRREARKREIGILPGVELSVQGGRSGVHILIVFDPETWVFNNAAEDYINRFLDNAFPQIPNRESEDVACEWTLSQTLEKLEEHRQNGRDSFVILAHPDDAKGAFKELGAGLKSHFNDLFETTVLAVQKARSWDNWNNLSQWLGKDWRPAQVEGSDCKSLDDVGRGHLGNGVERKTFLKLGALTLQAVRLALLMKGQRVSGRLPEPTNGRVDSITFAGGLLDGQTLLFSPDMTNFIGIRGSGKSSILECLRYLLKIDVSPSDEDADYKRDLVTRTLGSGGKMKASVVRADGTAYQVERIAGESPQVSRDGEVIPNLRPESILKARYFGQKDLAKFSEKRFGKELVDRFTSGGGSREEEIETVRNRLEQRLVTLAQAEKYLGKIEETKSQLAEVKESLKKFEEQNLDEKLKGQIALENDLKEADEICEFEEEAVSSLRRWLEDYAEAAKRRLARKPASESEAFSKVFGDMKEFSKTVAKVEGVLKELEKTRDITKADISKLRDHFESQKEAFAEIRRNLKLKDDLSPDTYVQLSKRKTTLEAKVHELDRLARERNSTEERMLKDLSELQRLWNQEYRDRSEEIKRLNEASGDLQIHLVFKGDKEAFIEKLNSLTTGLQRRTLQKVCDSFADGVELYRDLFGEGEYLRKAGLSPEQVARLKDSIKQNLKSLLTYRPPDRVNILYKEKPLHEHSLGQRATALMLFLLSQQDFDVLIVDQPEDDLDNQTIYSEVIQRILELKGKRQILFATHSPNIPVLGDAEQVFRCGFAPQNITVFSGTIDDPKMQREIVDVMEGGEEAFQKRKQIYEAWSR